MDLTPLIKAENVSFSYAKQPVLRGNDFSINSGEIVTLLGPNGCGKSTLIKLLLGILRPSNGRVLFHGTDIAHIRPKRLACEIAYVPQNHRSAFPYAVIDIALMGRIPHKTFFFKYSKEDLDTAHEVLQRLSILHLAERPYTEISGGERQLTMIARALTQGARVFLMDEPSTGLDYGNQLRLLEQISKLAQEGYTFVKSTHSPEHALWVADRAILMKNGAIMADGVCDEVINTTNISNLYCAKVNVVKMNSFFQVCIPGAAYRGREETDSRKKERPLPMQSMESPTVHP